jgi:hypothetical protein
MWLEASIWIWGPLAVVSGAWMVRRSLVVERELRRLRERVQKLEAVNDSSPRRAAVGPSTERIRDGRTKTTGEQRIPRDASNNR